MNNSVRPILRIIRELCAESGVSVRTFASDFAFVLQKDSRRELIYGYRFGINSAAAQALCDSKSALSELLGICGIPAVPHELLLHPSALKYIGQTDNALAIAALASKYPDAVCKPDCGTGGNKVVRASGAREIATAVKNLFLTERAVAVCPFADIKNEYRAVVLRGEVWLVFGKVRLNGEWRHNLELGARAEIIFGGELRERIVGLALAAANAAGIEFASVDIVDDGECLRVLEINGGVMLDNFAAGCEENYAAAKEIYRAALNFDGGDRI